ncbi:ROK family protein, partial [Streptomyces sp. NPDC058667]
MNVFGVDIGGSGIKGAPVDLERGALTEERHKVLTPQPAPPHGGAGWVVVGVVDIGVSRPGGGSLPG